MLLCDLFLKLTKSADGCLLLPAVGRRLHNPSIPSGDCVYPVALMAFSQCKVFMSFWNYGYTVFLFFFCRKLLLMFL